MRHLKGFHVFPQGGLRDLQPHTSKHSRSTLHRGAFLAPKHTQVVLKGSPLSSASPGGIVWPLLLLSANFPSSKKKLIQN